MVRAGLLFAGAGLWLLARRGHRVRRVLRVNRLVEDVERSARFYKGVGFRTEYLASSAALLRLGRDYLMLVQGSRGPAAAADDLWFQHLALVVDDMAEAHRRLGALSPAAISEGGPVTLPPRNGSVAAFKFRDPDGHPLELIHFPPGQGRGIWQHAGPGPFLGIDHSALAVSDTDRSVRFYRRLGFHVDGRSINAGPAQARLDGLADARTHVTGLRPSASSGPGVELLAYVPPGRPACGPAAQWTTLLVPGARGPRFMRDPDGHVLLLTPTA